MGADRRGRTRSGHRPQSPGEPHVSRNVARRQAGSSRAARRGRQGPHTGTVTTVDQLYTEWVAELRRKGRSPNTIYGYQLVYERNIRPTLGKLPVTKVNTEMLTDLYGAHQARGLAARSVHQIHACLSSMFTQACRWGWRDSNPGAVGGAAVAPNVVPVVPTPDEVLALIEAAAQSRRPEYARAILVAATTGVRRAELCALRRRRDVDWEGGC